MLLHGQPPVREGLAQDGGDAFPVGVGRAQVAHVGDLFARRAMGDVHKEERIPRRGRTRGKTGGDSSLPYLV
ncbi:hypothetical protein GCM10010177_38770 [Actinomadura citrea]|nr:hypothetical protein GCM10010177_38770 [Actinomadura citrea]